jgi:hypothetical protein
MKPEKALSYAIFAINTWMDPHASRPQDIDKLEAKADKVLAALTKLRDEHRGQP